MEKFFDITVIGGGHAGIEAAIVAAKMGLNTALITLEKNKIGLMSCNPAIGGLAKGQLVREIDALGGVMGEIIDESGIHFKMLNTSKGPAVQSPRAQADRGLYAKVAQKHIFNQPNLTVIEDMGIAIEVSGYKVTGLRLLDSGYIKTRAIVITAGTFLNGIIYIGLNKLSAGRAGELPGLGITESLESLGFSYGRLKTGTPPRIHKDSIDYSKIEVQQPDDPPQPFSYSTETLNQKQIDCYITYTNARTHEILETGFSRSPLFMGTIKGVGPRYCPSIEDKVKRFADRVRHQLFLEPEGYQNEEIYVNGFSTSLPADVQEKGIHSVAGLEKAKIIRLGYAVEYDFFHPSQLKYTLETKSIEHLYFAGQINGTSGYEEAAAQGFVAGLNAALKLKEMDEFKIERSQAYIGVLVDDLINKIHDEPYRMFTSRAEFRLLLRQDNADLRLLEIGRKYGLIKDQVFDKYLNRLREIDHIKKTELFRSVDPKPFNGMFKGKSAPIRQKTLIRDLIKRPEICLSDMIKLTTKNSYSAANINEVEFNTKYSGYVDRQLNQVERFKSIENKKIPVDIDYSAINALSVESREKLIRIRPSSLGQASRISGVSPADLSVLVIYIEKFKHRDVSRETTNEPV